MVFSEIWSQTFCLLLKIISKFWKKFFFSDFGQYLLSDFLLLAAEKNRQKCLLNIFSEHKAYINKFGKIGIFINSK
jgi:hypothetical protein